MTINEKIRERRLALGMSQEELAIKLGLKSRASINKIELGGGVKMKYINTLASALQCSVDYLMGWDEEIEQAAERLSKEDEEVFMEYKQLSRDQQLVIARLIQTMLKPE